MIPKVIHYCWFGKGELSTLHKLCIDTWYAKLPGYEIKLWDESNIERNNYIDHNLKKKNWAFVSDYVRLDVLERYGGIYLDVDVEVVKPFDDLLANKVFLGEELPGRLNNAVLGAEKGAQYVVECKRYMLERYTKKQPQMLSPEVATKVYNNHYKHSDDVAIFPSCYFYPYNPFSKDEKKQQLMSCLITEDTYAIHHWGKSWKLGLFERIKRKITGGK